jgi:transmembrane sensor
VGGKEDLTLLGARVRELLAADPRAGAETRLARAALLESVARRNAMSRPKAGSTHPRARWLALLLTGGAVAGLAALWFSNRPVTFQIGEAHPGLLGDVVEAPAGRTVPVAFSEGSRLAIHDGARMRVLSVDSHGDGLSVRVLLEDGAVDASIAHRRGVKTSWRFEAGPYQVAVTGTKFQMQFRSSERSLRVSTEEGRVVVTGGCLQAPSAVSAGQTLETSCPASETPSADGPPAAAAPPEPAPEPIRKPTPGRSNRWRELLAAGRLPDGLREAERANFARVCNQATPNELFALADAGRFAGRYAQAVDALAALRRRFPGTPEAGTAAFTLGRIAFENENAYARAAGWFDTYLHEQPTGALMGDAFGRLIEARLRSGDRAGARASAQQYLRRFPSGPYASEARGALSK